MSGRHNGRQMMNGTAYENGQRVLVDYSTREAAAPSSAVDVQRAALAIMAGLDGRTYAIIGEHHGVSAAYVSKCVRKIADKLGMPTPREEHRANYSQAAKRKRRRADAPPSTSAPLRSTELSKTATLEK